jgi:hypothetical protein
MNRLFWPASLLCVLTACTVNLSEPDGRPCDQDHACAPGQTCQAGTCVSTDGLGSTDGGSDGGVDAGFDAGTDAGFDAGTDAGMQDGGTDAGIQDGGTDAGMDAGTMTDAGTDAGTDPDGGVDGGYPPNTFFVDPAGDDTFDGRSPATPWKTVAKVNGAALPSGSWVLFKGGGVWYESLAPTRNGAQGAPLLFGAYGTGRPVFDGTGATGNSAVNVNGKSWITVQGLELRAWHGGNQLIYMANTHNVTFEDLYMHDGDKGFHASPSAASSDILVHNCVVQHISGGTFTHGGSIPAGNTNWVVSDSQFSDIEQSCFIDAGNGSQFLRNTFFNCGHITSTSDKHGLFLRGANPLVRDNVVYDTAGDCVNVGFEGATLEGNQLHTCGVAGIDWAEASTNAGTLMARRNRIWDSPTGITLGTATVQKFHLSNNSILTVLASSAPASAGVVVKSNTEVALENNLVTGSTATVLSVNRPAPSGTYTDRTNVWHTTASGSSILWNGSAMTLAQYQTASAQSTSVASNPMLTSASPTAPNFTLTTPTPAKDFGVTTPATGALTPGCDGAYDHYCGVAPEAGALELLTP